MIEHPIPLDNPAGKLKSIANPGRIPRIEMVLLLALVLIGFSLRIWKISTIGLDHFDEGVYAFSGLGVTDSTQPHRLYPEQVKFSPPVFFSLVGLSYHLFGGPSDTAAIFVNVLLGTLTIALVWWVGRAWFGAQVGIAAAALLSFNEYHIALSRTALTDVAFALFFLLALAVIVTTFQRQSLASAIVAGLTVGLAWNTKYHGWFALLISGAALWAFAWHCHVSGLSRKRLFILWAIMVAVAVACYLPWAFFIQSQAGGYSAMVQYQRTQLSKHWLTNLQLQGQKQLFLEGPFSRFSVLIAFLCTVLISGCYLRPSLKFFLILAFLVGSALLIGTSGTAILITLLAIPALLRKSTSFSVWLVLSWLTIWFFSTPLYRPFGRLVLPFSIASFLVESFYVSSVVNEPEHKLGHIAWRPILAAVAALTVFAIAGLMPNPSNPWRSSKSVSQAAAAMQTIIPPGSRVIVVGEPPLAFYLHLSNRPAFERVEDMAVLESLPTAVYIVTGAYAKCAPKLREGLKKLNNRLVPLGTFKMEPKDIRVLDDFLPREARLFRTHADSTYDLMLYYLLPKSSAS